MTIDSYPRICNPNQIATDAQMVFLIFQSTSFSFFHLVLDHW